MTANQGFTVTASSSAAVSANLKWQAEADTPEAWTELPDESTNWTPVAEESTAWN
jgi:hypothetical protein